ncbi:MAG: hypothetical protein RIS64_2703 [Bacteroidota bacterium]
MLKPFLFSCLATSLFNISCASQPSSAQTSVELPVKKVAFTDSIPKNAQPPSKNSKKRKIQVALLLDVSNSMDGLIDQAKSQLWKMVNKLANAKKENDEVEMNIALFEYGNDRLDAGEGYIRMVQSLGTDLDGVSEQLFKLNTKGGEEYCAWVIRSAVHNLQWSDHPADMKVIIIAGNEPFDQGPVPFRKSCEAANQKNIIINTIHCGDYALGVRTHWKDGADIGKGKYMNINTDEKVVHLPTPWDDKVIELNQLLNKTYISYGKSGHLKKERQMKEDANAASYSRSNAAQRSLSKSKGSYKNTEWDLVDAAEADTKFYENVKEDELPAEFKGKSKQEIKTMIDALAKQRLEIRKELREIEKKMEVFVAAERKKSANSSKTLDNVLIQTVVEQAQAQGFQFE